MKELIKSLEDGFIPLLESEKLFNILVLSKNNAMLDKFIKQHSRDIIFSASFSFNIFDFLTLTHLIHENIDKEKAKEKLENNIKDKFCNKTKIYLTKKYKSLKFDDYISTDELCESICDDLKAMDTHDASGILFDLFNFYDFRGYLAQHYVVIANLIKYYKKYDKDVVGNNIYKGSSIIAKLFDKKCELLVRKHIESLIYTENAIEKDFQMIGGGGSNLVFKIKDKVLKLGETRNCRKICVNHRILASLYRKLETDENGNELFYAEVMKYIETGVTPEERDELKSDLAKQGIIWDDDKLENCGYLPEGYDNICPIANNYEEVLANVDNPLYREQFNKQRKRVVVLDSDNMRLDTTRLQKY